MMNEIVDEECNLEVCKLDHDPPDDFIVCVCNSDREGVVVYFIIREFLCFCHFGLFMWALTDAIMMKELKLHIFYDFWVQVILCISAQMGVCGPIQSWWNRIQYGDEFWEYMPWYFKIYWAVFSMALPSSILSCIVYWTQVYHNCNKHIFSMLMNTASPILAVFEFLLIAFPLRLLHFMYFVIFYILYIGFTVIYQKCGGTGVCKLVPIYKVLDWRRPGEAVLAAFIGLVIGLAIYVLFCILSMLKLALKNRDE